LYVALLCFCWCAGLEVVLPPGELEARLAVWTPPKPKPLTGTLKKYRQLVQSAHVGAVTR
jgi:dihydroxyacid dehydratase/phosphogluconate dehydratase